MTDETGDNDPVSMDEDWGNEGFVLWKCNKLRQNDASSKEVYFHYTKLATRIMEAMQNNSVVQALSVDFRCVPPIMHGDMHNFIRTSSSLKEFEIQTFDEPEMLSNERRDRTLPFVNVLMNAFSLNPKNLEILSGVPLCQSTALMLSSTLRVLLSQNLRYLSIEIPQEEMTAQQARPRQGTQANGNVGVVQLVQRSLAPEFAQALASSPDDGKLEFLSIKWREAENFDTGEAFVAALPGSLPSTLHELEFNNFVNSDTNAAAIAAAIAQTEANLRAIEFYSCQFSSENFSLILESLAQNQPDLEMLHCGDLDHLSSPVFAETIGSSFLNLTNLRIGFQPRSMDHSRYSFEIFCDELPIDSAGAANIHTLILELHSSHETTLTVRFLDSLAVLIPKLPSLKSVSYSWTCIGVQAESIPCDFLKALENHSNLTELPKFIEFPPDCKKEVEYYLLRNSYKERFQARKNDVLNSLEGLFFNTKSDDSNAIGLTYEMLRARDDMFQPGVDHGKANTAGN